MVSSSSAPVIRRFPGTLEETEPESDNEDDQVEIKDKARTLRLWMEINKFIFEPKTFSNIKLIHLYRIYRMLL